MSKNIIVFPTKNNIAPVLKSGKIRKIRYSGYATSLPEDPIMRAGVEFARAYDFKGAWANYPEEPVIPYYTKSELRNQVIAVSEFATAAVFAKNLLLEDLAAKELAKLFMKYLDQNTFGVTLSLVPEHLIGYLVWLGEDLATSREYGQHPLSPIFHEFNWGRTAINYSLIKRRK